MKANRIPLPDDDAPGSRHLPEPAHTTDPWREHDLLVRRFHIAGLAPDEIAVVLGSKGLKVRTWHVSESFVRNRLKAIGLKPNTSRLFYQQNENRYRAR